MRIDGLVPRARRLLLLYRVFASRLTAGGYVRLARFALRKAAGRPVPPMTLMLAVTGACQCRCVHCAVNSSPSFAGRILSLPETEKLIDDAAALGIVKLGFTGGEPLLRGGLTGLVARAAKLGLSVSIDTNGFLLDRRTAGGLALAGAANVCVSLDSPDAATHDRLRALPGSFARAVEAIKACAAAGLPCVASTYLTDRMFRRGDLEKIIRLALDSGAAGGRVMFPVHSGRLAGRSRPLLTAGTAEEFFSFTVKKYPSVYSESPLFDFSGAGIECSMRRGLSVYCAPGGDIRGCYASGRVLGNVLRSPLGEILRGYGEGCAALDACNLAGAGPVNKNS